MPSCRLLHHLLCCLQPLLHGSVVSLWSPCSRHSPNVLYLWIYILYIISKRQAIKHSSKETSKQAIKQASKQARKQSSKEAEASPMPSRRLLHHLLCCLQPLLSSPPRSATREPPDEGSIAIRSTKRSLERFSDAQ